MDSTIAADSIIFIHLTISSIMLIPHITEVRNHGEFGKCEVIYDTS